MIEEIEYNFVEDDNEWCTCYENFNEKCKKMYF